ncbi:MAG: hypothetical protein WBA25_08255 [Jannaschia sp.]
MEDGWQLDRRGWHVRRDGATFALSRRMPLRWDVEAATAMADLGRRRLAHAVRQDIWRAFRNVRGFAPAVEVSRRDGGTIVRAGGAVEGRVPPGMASGIARMLDDPERRAEWVRSAAHRSAG